MTFVIYCWIGGLIDIYVQDGSLIALYFTQVKPGKSGTIQNINLRKSPPEYTRIHMTTIINVLNNFIPQF